MKRTGACYKQYKDVPHRIKDGTIGRLAIDLIKQRKGDSVIVREVRTKFPGSAFKGTHVRWYRNAINGGWVV